MLAVKLSWFLAAFVLVTTATTSEVPNDVEDYSADEELDEDQLQPDEGHDEENEAGPLQHVHKYVDVDNRAMKDAWGWGSRRRSSWGGFSSRRRSSWTARRRSSWTARRRSSWTARRRRSWSVTRRRRSWTARRRRSWSATRRRRSWTAARRRRGLRIRRRRRQGWRIRRRRRRGLRIRRRRRRGLRIRRRRRRGLRIRRRRRRGLRIRRRRRRGLRIRRRRRRGLRIRRRRRRGWKTRRRRGWRRTRRRRRSFWRRVRLRKTAQKAKKKVKGWFGKLWKGIKTMIGKSRFRIRVAIRSGGHGGGGRGGGGHGGGRGSGGDGSGGSGQPNQPTCNQQCKAQIRKALNAIKTLKQSYCAFYVASQNQTDFLVNRDENNASSLLQKYASDSFSMYKNEVATVQEIDKTVKFESKVALKSDCMKVNGKNLPCYQGKQKTVKQFHDLKCFQPCMGDVNKCQISDEKLSKLIEGAVKAFNDKIIKVAG